MNWLHGTPTTVKPRAAYSSCSASSAPYCGVSPQRLAAVTTSAAFPPVTAPRVDGVPSRVVTGSSRRSVMGGAALPGLSSFHAADIVGGVDGFLPQRLDRHDLQRTRVRRCQHDPRRGAGLVGLQPADGEDAPPVAGLQAGEAVLGDRRREVVAEVALHLQEIRGDDGADG